MRGWALCVDNRVRFSNAKEQTYSTCVLSSADGVASDLCILMKVGSVGSV
jgi:hypothetical protein